MGTDIHMLGEIRLKWERDIEWGKWEAFPIPSQFQWRNYDFFGALAGVRRNVDFPAGNQGLPDDMSDTAHMWRQDWETTETRLYDVLPTCGDHSFGHITLQRIESYPWGESVSYPSTLEFVKRFMDFLRGEGEPWSGECEVRVLYSFDS